MTLYNVPYQLVRRIHLFSGALTRSLFPRFSSQSAGDAHLLGVRAVSSLSVLTMPLMVLAMLGLYPFMVVWVGHGFAVQSSPVGEILLLGTWTSSMAFIPYALLQGQGRPRTVALLHVAEAPFLLGAVWLGVHFDGLQGAAWAMLIRNTMDSLAFYILAGMLRQMAARLFSAAAWIVAALIIARSVGGSFGLHIIASAVLLAASCAWVIHVEPMAQNGLTLIKTFFKRGNRLTVL